MIGKLEQFKTESRVEQSLELSAELKLAEDLARQAGSLLRSRQGGNLKICYKANGEIVTAADLAANEIICHGVAARFPQDSICSEENQAAGILVNSLRTWIVDPLDSTSNYVQGGNEYSVSIGLVICGEAVLGVVYNPARNEMVRGYRGYGASWNGVPVRTTFGGSPERPRILVSSKEWKRGLETAARNSAAQPMASMAYKLARVAAGREDAVLSLKQRKPWGTCAGTALVLAAGGQVTSLDGESPIFDCQQPHTFCGLVAASTRLHPSILKIACGWRSTMKTRYSA
jgi:myo-inositol-1(or 4)-monophosphatase